MSTSTNITIQVYPSVKVIAKAKLTSDGEPLFGMEIKFYKSMDAQTWSYIGSSYTNENGEASITTNAYIGEYFKAVFEGTEDYEPSEATARFTAPQVTILEEISKLKKAIAIIGILVLILLLSREKQSEK